LYLFLKMHDGDNPERTQYRTLQDLIGKKVAADFGESCARSVDERREECGDA
jgi:hypothetical protein